ncbi:MAG: thiamine-phosphate kinase [Bacteroidota bacterium]|nr:thiamine-phosphate kinase [Bacteroidota bacterium]
MMGRHVGGVGEFKLIRRLANIIGKPRGSRIVRAIGDDAAVYRTAPGRVHVVSTDAFADQYHFDARFYSWVDVGGKAMAASISDIAAMNAVPRYATVALALPPKFLVADAERIYEGLRLCAEQQDVDIIGGDTTRSDRVTLSITIIGEAAEQDVVYRDGGLPGDLLCVTGPLGAADIGLQLLRFEAESQSPPMAGLDEAIVRQAKDRHLRPMPRTDMVNRWKKAGVKPHALIDISDGLTAEVHHICRASGCGAAIDLAAVPVARAVRMLESDPARAMEFALSCGDEYELLFAAPAEDCARMDACLFTVIGRLTADAGAVFLRREEGDEVALGPGGHDHFAGP